MSEQNAAAKHIETTAPASMDFMARRMALMARIEELVQEEGAALLDGKSFNRVPLDRRRAELEALDAAEGESVRRDDARQAIADAERRKVLTAALATAEEQRLAAIDRAERAAREMADALVAARKAAQELVAIGSQLGRRPVIQLAALDHDDRLSRHLSFVLRPVTGLRRRFGSIPFPEANHHYGKPWRASEADLVGPYLNPENKDA